MLVVCTFPSFRLIYSCSYWLSLLSNFKSGSCYNFLSVAMHCSSIGTILQFFYNLGREKQNALYADSIFNKKSILNTLLDKYVLYWRLTSLSRVVICLFFVALIAMRVHVQWWSMHDWRMTRRKWQAGFRMGFLFVLGNHFFIRLAPMFCCSSFALAWVWLGNKRH